MLILGLDLSILLLGNLQGCCLHLHKQRLIVNTSLFQITRRGKENTSTEVGYVLHWRWLKTCKSFLQHVYRGGFSERGSLIGGGEISSLAGQPCAPLQLFYCKRGEDLPVSDTGTPSNSLNLVKVPCWVIA